MVRVKICGITNIKDAIAAVQADADALGFVFAESPRMVEVSTVSAILHHLPPFVTTIGVFAGMDANDIAEIMETTGLHFAQLHGPQAESLLDRPRRWGIIRAIRVRSPQDIEREMCDRVVLASNAVLLDSYVEGKMGGTGQQFDWQLALDWKALATRPCGLGEKPLILAGGLTPENVVEAIRKVRPYAVDVSTGVEIYPGKKDHQKVKEFIRNAKRTI